MFDSQLRAILIGALSVVAPSLAASQDSATAAAARRVATTAQLAAQEYALGVSGGRVVAAPEVEEARLFLGEARRAAARLPGDAARRAASDLDEVIALVDRTADPDSVRRRVTGLVAWLGKDLNVVLDEIPEAAPSLARGREIYQQACGSCHGLAGRGDGPAAGGLDPPPANLADAAGLRASSPLDFYRRVTIGVAGTSMAPYEQVLSADDRWAVALYASVLRLPRPAGVVPAGLRLFPATARMSDGEVLAALGPSATDAALAAVRTVQPAASDRSSAAGIFSAVRRQLDSALQLAIEGRREAARGAALDAYMTFERVEWDVRVKDPPLALEAEEAFTTLRTRAAAGAAPPQLRAARQDLARVLERAERAVGDKMPPTAVFAQSFLILLREGLEAILVVGALVAFLVKTGNAHRRRDIHLGVGAALLMSLVTAILLETLFALTPAHQEILEGATMLAATAMLFYVSYWLLAKLEVAKWNRFVKGKIQQAVGQGSVLALASVAFLAVYREGFETVLFYKALALSSSGGVVVPLTGGIMAGGAVLAAVYVAINRFGVRLPLKPLFGATSALLYLMAVIFAGKGIAELQETGLLSLTPVSWAPRMPALGLYPTAESLGLQALLAVLAAVAALWVFVVQPRRLRVTHVLVPEPGAATMAGKTETAREVELLRSIERIEADLAEVRSELERIKERAVRSER